MNAEKRNRTQEILSAIGYGELPPAQTEEALLAIIRAESERMDGPADMGLVTACLDLLEQMKQAGCIPVQREHARSGWLRRTACLAAAAAVLFALGGLHIRGWMDAPAQEDQQAVKGISVEMVASAMAEGDRETVIPVEDVSQLGSLLGLELHLPEQLMGEWHAGQGEIRYLPEYIRVSMTYEHASAPEKSISCVVLLFTETDNLYLSIEQTGEGGFIQAEGRRMYISSYSGRIAAHWQAGTMSVRLSGHITSGEAVGLMLALTGESG